MALCFMRIFILILCRPGPTHPTDFPRRFSPSAVDMPKYYKPKDCQPTSKVFG